MSNENIGADDLQKMKKLDEMKRQIISAMLSKDAFERLGRVRAINQELASQAELYLMQVYQSGKMRDKVSDGQMRQVLGALTQKKEFKIKRV